MDQVETSRTSLLLESAFSFPVDNDRPAKPTGAIWGTGCAGAKAPTHPRHLARIAPRREGWITRNRYYYELLARLLRFLVEPQKRVLSVRCGTGNLLAAVRPNNGKGIDICAEMVEIARQRNPSFEFRSRFPGQGRVPAGIQTRREIRLHSL